MNTFINKTISDTDQGIQAHVFENDGLEGEWVWWAHILALCAHPRLRRA